MILKSKVLELYLNISGYLNIQSEMIVFSFLLIYEIHVPDKLLQKLLLN